MDLQKRVGFLVSEKFHRQIRLLAVSQGISIKELVLRALRNTYKELEATCEK